MTDTSDTRTLDVTPLHRDLYTAVAVGGIEDGAQMGEDAITARWYQTSTTLNQMLDLARALDDPYIAARVKDMKAKKRQFFSKALDAFKERFESAVAMVEAEHVEFVAQPKDAPVNDHRSLQSYAPDASPAMFAVAYDDYGNVRSQYTVGFVNGAPIVPTGDTVNRPHVVLEKYALAHALTKGRASPGTSAKESLTA